MVVNMSDQMRQIPVTIDKSHLITIGEKLYADKADLLRELINNAYDADATEVWVTLEADRLVVKDDGCGMDEKGLYTYFTIGSQHKKSQPVSPKFQRQRIGEFGIGKFAVLAACKVFQVETQRDQFHTRLIFDKEEWQHHANWHIDTQPLPPDSLFGNGTTVTLTHLTHQFSSARARRYLQERIPLHVPNFSVYVNGDRLEEEVFYGREHTFRVITSFGIVHGQLILTNASWKREDAGIGIFVRNVLIKKDTFGLESTKQFGATRLRGKIHADFLPITSSRDDLIYDTPEYSVFIQVVEKELRKILKVAKELANQRADQRSSQALKEALLKIGRALKRQEGLKFGSEIPVGESPLPQADSTDAGEDGFDVSQAAFVDPGTNLPPDLKNQLEQSKQRKHAAKRGVILGTKSIIRSLHFQHVDVAVRMEHLRDNSSESTLSGGVIFINLDHPLYQLYHQDERLLLYHIARIVTKELALQAEQQSPSEAFQLQSELLTEAFRHTKIL